MAERQGQNQEIEALDQKMYHLVHRMTYHFLNKFFKIKSDMALGIVYSLLFNENLSPSVLIVRQEQKYVYGESQPPIHNVDFTTWRNAFNKDGFAWDQNVCKGCTRTDCAEKSKLVKSITSCILLDEYFKKTGNLLNEVYDLYRTPGAEYIDDLRKQQSSKTSAQIKAVIEFEEPKKAEQYWKLILKNLSLLTRIKEGLLLMIPALDDEYANCLREEAKEEIPNIPIGSIVDNFSNISKMFSFANQLRKLNVTKSPGCYMPKEYIEEKAAKYDIIYLSRAFIVFSVFPLRPVDVELWCLLTYFLNRESAEAYYSRISAHLSDKANYRKLVQGKLST